MICICSANAYCFVCTYSYTVLMRLESISHVALVGMELDGTSRHNIHSNISWELVEG